MTFQIIHELYEFLKGFDVFAKIYLGEIQTL